MYLSIQNNILLLDHDFSSQSIDCDSPGSLAIEYVEHLRACHSKAPLDTRGVVVLPGWTKFETVIKE